MTGWELLSPHCKPNSWVAGMLSIKHPCGAQPHCCATRLWWAISISSNACSVMKGEQWLNWFLNLHQHFKTSKHYDPKTSIFSMLWWKRQGWTDGHYDCFVHRGPLGELFPTRLISCAVSPLHSTPSAKNGLLKNLLGCNRNECGSRDATES